MAIHDCREEDVTEGEEPHGHVTSISVLRSYRRLGLAKRLMIQSREYALLDSESLVCRTLTAARRRSDGARLQGLVCSATRAQVEPCRAGPVQGRTRLPRARHGEELL